MIPTRVVTLEAYSAAGAGIDRAWRGASTIGTGGTAVITGLVRACPRVRSAAPAESYHSAVVTTTLDWLARPHAQHVRQTPFHADSSVLNAV
jgi:hypothetical protein